jgi:hypothetical protein
MILIKRSCRKSVKQIKKVKGDNRIEAAMIPAAAFSLFIVSSLSQITFRNRTSIPVPDDRVQNNCGDKTKVL